MATPSSSPPAEEAPAPPGPPAAPAPPPPARRPLRTLAVCAALCAAVLAAYLQVRGHAYVSFDDRTYVAQNEVVGRGLTLDGLRWALTTRHAANWHPLTWLSHMLDVELFGLDAGAHALVNVALHALAACLLLLALHAATRAFWPSALVAALFALHPLHVESVAWVSERKDVLAGVFFGLTLLLYVAYARRGGALRWLAVLLSLCLGLAAKSMLVTLPALLLLLDAWPLGRFRERSATRLVLEKLPLFAAAGAASWLTAVSQEAGGAVSSVTDVPLGLRLANAAVAAVTYLRKAVWPSDLAVLYPHPKLLYEAPLDALALPAMGASVLLALVTLTAVHLRRRAPWLAVGWLWYLGTLVPVLGLVQVGYQSLADRYTYLPLVGPFLALAFAARAWVGTSAGRRAAATGAALLALAGCWYGTWRQARYWRDDESLYRRALAVEERNFLAHNNLAAALQAQGRNEEALAHLARSAELHATGKTRRNLGLALANEGELDGAVEHLTEVVARDPSDAEAAYVLAEVLQVRGEPERAVGYLEAAVAARPEMAEAHRKLGVLLAGMGELERAAGSLARVVALTPDDVDAWFNLGLCRALQGRTDEARAALERAVALAPDSEATWQGAIDLELGAGELARAERRYGEALQALPESAALWAGLGRLQVATGREGDAEAALRRALALEPGRHDASVELAFLLAAATDERLRDGGEALRLALAAVDASGGRDPAALDALAAARAEGGDTAAAAEAAARALELARAAGDAALAERVAARLEEYTAGRPHRGPR